MNRKQRVLSCFVVVVLLVYCKLNNNISNTLVFPDHVIPVADARQAVTHITGSRILSSLKNIYISMKKVVIKNERFFLLFNRIQTVYGKQAFRAILTFLHKFIVLPRFIYLVTVSTKLRKQRGRAVKK